MYSVYYYKRKGESIQSTLGHKRPNVKKWFQEYLIKHWTHSQCCMKGTWKMEYKRPKKKTSSNCD
ncbi:hypothetical protein BLOT_004590 [Blomia tropicalis]|nr:hypothetical protein BLOT_004590 [Blomia tropicalis]